MSALFDQDARDRAQRSISETLLVEASAGTGKTTTMLGRLLFLLTTPTPEGEPPPRLTEIVAITFTERAAQELKDRLRARLFATVSSVSPAQPGLVQQALNDLEEAPIGTIHGLCARILRQYPIEAAVDVEFRVAEERTAAEIWRDVWRSWITTQFHRSDLPEAVQRSVELGLTPDDLHSVAEAIRRFRMHPVPEMLGPETAAAPGEDAINHLRELLPASNRDTRGRTLSEKRLATVERVRAFVEALSAATTQEDRVNRLLQPLPDSSAAELVPVLTYVEELRTRYTHSLIAGIVRWMTHPEEGVLAAYARAKDDVACLDFDDLLIKARDLVRNRSDVRRQLQEQFRAIIVDEFQDTDPVQAELIILLSQRISPLDDAPALPWEKSGVSPGKLCVVGDPKQSIYRFRGADIETYSRVAALIGAENRCHLRTNFRSHGSIIRAVNAVFGQPGVFSSPDLPDEARMFIPAYQPLEPPAGTQEDTEARVLWVEPATGRFDALKDARPVEAALVANAVQQVVAEGWEVRDPRTGQLRPAWWGDVALLCRRWAAAEELEDEFRRRGIPYRILGGKGLFEREEVVRLVSLLRALEQPHDSLSVIAALRSAFFGVSDAELALAAIADASSFDYTGDRQDALPETIGRAFALLREVHASLNELRPSEVIEFLFEKTGVLAAYAQQPDGEQSIANLLKIIDEARRYEAGNSYSFRGFCNWLRTLRLLNAEESEAELDDEAGGRVQLLTIHKAKGLEFPVVFVLDLGAPLNNPPNSRKLIMAGGNASSLPRCGLSVKKLPGGASFRTRDWEEVREADRERESAEMTRLLYVALTRARDYLLLPRVLVTKNATWQNLIESASDSKEWPVWQPRDFAASQSATLAVEHARGISAFETELRRFEEKRRNATQQASRPRIRIIYPSSEHPDEPERWTDESPTLPAHGSPEDDSGRRLGTVVHRALQQLHPADLSDVERVVKSEAEEEDLNDEELARATALVRGCFSLSVINRAYSAPQRWKEVPVTLCEDRNGVRNIIRGVCDLVFTQGNELILVDYKTDRGSPQDADNLKLKYKPQLDEYVNALNVATGLPVAEAWLAFLGLDGGPIECRVV
ncbi:MAG: ATP-dependent helicase/nuclease subunit A [Candidatus Latescibacteria bacterium ADurb.Bin168]|nr:MAG: ATP-dependent helicase/nuclease subunit A [Candidatus Latescibacteria bacterium ADurb.Bin168]